MVVEMGILLQQGIVLELSITQLWVYT